MLDTWARLQRESDSCSQEFFLLLTFQAKQYLNGKIDGRREVKQGHGPWGKVEPVRRPGFAPVPPPNAVWRSGSCRSVSLHLRLASLGEGNGAC